LLLGAGVQSEILTYSQLIMQVAAVTVLLRLTATTQVYEPVNHTAHLLLETSSQGPYQLERTSAACVSATGVCAAWPGSR
jgi:hypothetical protein